VRGVLTPSYPLLSEARQKIDQFFYHTPPAPPVLEYGAIRGMIDALGDKFSLFVAPPVTQSENNVLAGTYGGIGVQIKRSDTAQFVLYPFPDGPAAKAGLQNGDILASVAGKPILVTDQPDAVDQSLRGEVKAGSAITLTIQRPPELTVHSFTVAYGVINVPSVIARMLPPDPKATAAAPLIGYIQLTIFTDRTPDELKAAIASLMAHSAQAIVLDLRNNPGGLLDSAIKSAGVFLDGGPVLYEEAQGSERVDNAPTGGATALPMVVLINGGTASAAELLTAAIHDRGRSIAVIGQTSYGKGTVQIIVELSDHSSIHLTEAEWLSPTHRPINGKGLTPDIPIVSDPSGRDLELQMGVAKLTAALLPTPVATAQSTAAAITARS